MTVVTIYLISVIVYGQHAQSLEDALKAALEMVMRAAHAETGTFWFYDRFKDGRICAKAVRRRVPQGC